MESVPPEWAGVRVGLMVSFAVGAFEGVRTRLSFLGCDSRWVNFFVGFTTPSELSVVFRFVRTIALYAL